jgi:hypothetical protein
VNKLDATAHFLLGKSSQFDNNNDASVYA